MPCSTQARHWVAQLHRFEFVVAIAYAASLPLSMTVSWALLIAALICLAVDLVFCPESRDQLRTAAPLAVPMLLFATAAGASGAFNGGAGEAVRSVVSLKALLAYFFASLCFWRNSDLGGKCLSVLLPIGAVAGIWGTIQQVFNFHPFGFHWLQGTGFLGGPMAYAGQMQMFAMLGLAIFLTRGFQQLPWRLSNRWIFLGITAANLLGLVFCGERSAWLGGLVGIIVATAVLSWRTFIKAVIALLLVAVISWWSIPLVHSRVDSLLSGRQDVSTRVRLVVWQRAIDEWHKSPVVGIGFLRFPHLDIPEAIVPGRSHDLNHAHSNYLQILSTTGVIGLLAYLWLLLMTFRWCRMVLIRGRNDNNLLQAGIGVGLLAAMSSLAVAGLFEYNFGTAQVRLAQWFLLGLVALAVPCAREHTVHHAGDDDRRQECAHKDSG